MKARAWAWWLGLLGAVAGARELDPAACTARFEVQRDKIIRTEESREMGARYISELDVGARAECLRLCCETDGCDVFVYEEKGPGSCYLFKCGPPEDFRCKFTAHSNFSSGVLALSRRLAELQDQEQLAHHERELASLRSATSSTPSTTTAATAPPPPPAPLPQQSPTGKCSRYQFECRRGGECIAVYNACDGVPQCADGSDEAAELGCPQPAAPAPVVVPARATHPPPPPPPTPPPMKPIQDSVEMGAGNDGLLMENSGFGDHWPHRLTQAQPQHRYTNDVAPSSHIFSHKGGLLQEAESGPGPQYPAFEPPWPRHSWNQQQTGVGMDNMGGWGGGRDYPRLEWGEPEPRRAWPVPQPRPDPEASVYIPQKTMPEIPMVYSSQQQTLRDSPKKGLELNTGTDTRPAATVPPPPAPPDHREEDRPPVLENTTKPKVHSEKFKEPNKASASHTSASSSTNTARSGHEEHAAAERHLAADEHDGLSEHPPAAVLLLVLGVIMTVAMGGMLGCRARAARRRLRRGKPFAHDADYLVNGMYL